MDWELTAHGDAYRDVILNRPPLMANNAYYALNNIVEKISYNLNEYGFRASIFDDEQTRAAFGCSFTFGTEVKHTSTWPYIIGAYNFGVPGSSIQTVTRLIEKWIPKSSVEEVFICLPSPSRREIFDPLTKTYTHLNIHNLMPLVDFMYHKTIPAQNERTIKFIEDYPYLNILDDGVNTKIMNDCLDVIEKICHDRKLRIIGEEALPVNDLNSRCGTHPGESWHRKVAKKFLDV